MQKRKQKRRLILAALLSGGLPAGMLAGDGPPARAAGTAAGTAISNTATATYSDPSTSTAYNATSHTVSVTVAEVAGVTAGGGVPADVTPGHANNILPGDTLHYDFVVTNIGNAADPLTLPGAATLTGPGTAGPLLYSTDGGATFPNAIPAGGLTTAAIPANGSVVVRVPVTVAATAATGDVIKVLLGDAGGNDNAADTQNVADPSPAAAGVHTASATAQNGLRETSFFGSGTVGTQPQAFAALLLTRTGFAQGATPAQDTLTYGLGLNVTTVYTYNGTAWTTTGSPVVIPGLAANASVAYTVAVQLPAATHLSTDTGYSSGYPVPVLAFVDSNGNGTFDAGEPGNRTIDRLYTGFLQVTKRAQIVAADGTTVIQPYSAGPSSANIQPGRFIDYQITYTNISSAAGSGSGDALLTASGAVITGGGTAGGNNWALDVNGSGALDTSNVIGRAVDAGGAVSFFNGNPPAAGTDISGTTAATDVTKYVDTVSTPLAPGASYVFTFRRRIN